MSYCCPHCGAEQKKGTKLCSACGKKIKQKPVTKKQNQSQQQDKQHQTSVPPPTAQKSRKKLIIGISAIIIAVVIILSILLYFQGGINPFSSADSRFVGEWEENRVENPLLWKFNGDNTLEKESSDGERINVSTWTVKDTQLCLNNTLCYSYEFSNNENILTLNGSEESDLIVLTKKDQQGTSQTPGIACITNSTTNRVIITSIDTNVKWRDIAITTNPVASWQVQDANKIQLAKIGTTATIVRYVSVGDNILILDAVGDVAVTLTYVPTNALLGTWTVNV
jgi:hypothetical protein